MLLAFGDVVFLFNYLRIQLSEHETEVTDLESKLDKVSTCIYMYMKIHTYTLYVMYMCNTHVPYIVKSGFKNSLMIHGRLTCSFTVGLHVHVAFPDLQRFHLYNNSCT